MNKIYEEIFKQQAVELVFSSGYTQAQVADNLDYLVFEKKDS